MTKTKLNLYYEFKWSSWMMGNGLLNKMCNDALMVGQLHWFLIHYQSLISIEIEYKYLSNTVKG